MYALAASLGVQRTFFTAAVSKDLLLTKPFVFCSVLSPGGFGRGGEGAAFPERSPAIACDSQSKLT